LSGGSALSAAFIIDCSITMAWCFSDEATAAVSKLQDRLERETALVPSHWFLEVTNVVAMAEKRKRILTAKTTAFLELLEEMDIEVDEEATSRAFEHLLPLCRRIGLTGYDAVYLDLALRRGLPLASLDDDLRAAAQQLGIEILEK
jgi:predicted nucleic acid-binding protein